MTIKKYINSLNLSLVFTFSVVLEWAFSLFLVFGMSNILILWIFLNTAIFIVTLIILVREFMQSWKLQGTKSMRLIVPTLLLILAGIANAAMLTGSLIDWFI